jgi:MerR family transcriptional regulator, Zn(II)-responsive regulator of zntA
MAGEAKTFSLREMVKRTGATPRTIRFYEEVGLISPIGRTPGGHRLYSERELEKLTFIADLRDAGLSIEEIKELFDLRHAAGNARTASAEVARKLTEKIDDLRRRMTVLGRLRDEFSSSVDIFRHSCSDCKHPPGQEVCDACNEIDHARLPRTFRWLWNVH